MAKLYSLKLPDANHWPRIDGVNYALVAAADEAALVALKAALSSPN